MMENKMKIDFSLYGCTLPKSESGGGDAILASKAIPVVEGHPGAGCRIRGRFPLNVKKKIGGFVFGIFKKRESAKVN